MSAAPQKLGRYEVIEEIGKGAMGVVYLAKDPLIGRLVALKTFRVGFAARDDELTQFRSRFVREAQSAGILSHPNIVTIHDVVDEGPLGGCFIAMEYVKGTNLKQLLQRPDPFPSGFVVDVIAQVAEALDYAHSRGVVHRDVKPANILINADNRVKITDFGIARMDTSNLTMEGQLLGTPNYMAPEQIQGRDVDHRADIFSLGVVFYEMVTRKKPFQGENMTAVTHKIVYDSFTPPEDIVRDLSKGLSLVLKRCLEKDPNRRFPRASEVARELRAVMSAQQSMDDTGATQEVDLIGEGAAPPAGLTAPVAVATAPVAAPAPVVEQPSDLAPTQMVARPTIPIAAPPDSAPPAPAAAPGAGEGAVADNAPTQLVARPPISEFRATLASPPPKEQPPATPAPPAGSASTVISAVPRVSKSAPVVPIGAPGSAKTASPATAPAAPVSRQRLIVAAAALAGVALFAALAVWIWGGGAPAAPRQAEVAPAPTPEQQTRITAASAIAEARMQLGLGNLDGALHAVARAELAEPGNAEMVKLREEIEARRQEVADAERLVQVEEGLKAARYAFAERRYSDAISAAKAVLGLDAASEEAKRVVADSERALRRLKEQRQGAILAAQQAPVAVPAPAPSATAPTAPAVDPATLREAQLQIAFASERSEGVLTIYAGERQILRESFRFLRRTGFLAREKTSGTIEATRKVPAGTLPLRIYVTLPGKATRAILLDADFPGGSSRTLRIHVDSEGAATAGLN